MREKQELLRILCARLDERLEPYLGSNLPPIRLRSSSECKDDYAIALNKKYQKLKGKKPGFLTRFFNSRRAKRYVLDLNERIPSFCIQLVPDTIYYNQGFTNFGHSCYHPELSLGHEVAHTRLISRSVINKISHLDPIASLSIHPIWITIQEGIADYLCSQVISKDAQLVLNRLYQEISKIVEGRSDDKRKRFEPYYYGFRFMKDVSEKLGENHAIELALNPLAGIDQLYLECPPGLVLLPSKEVFRLTEEELRDPKKYIERINSGGNSQ